MKVTVLYPHLNANVQKARYANQPGRPAATAERSSDPSAGGDSVQLSSTVRELQQAAKAGPAADTRTGRLGEIKRQIRDGSYRIDSEKIAARMLQDPFLNGVE